MPHVVSLALQEWVHDLNLSGCKKITNVNNLGNIHKLNLDKCCISDVSELGNVHELILSNTYVHDVSKLMNVHTLNLDKCYCISGTSSLYGTRCLSMCDGFNGVKDIGNLRKLEILEIDKKIYGIHFLKNLTSLKIKQFDGDANKINKLKKINKDVVVTYIKKK